MTDIIERLRIESRREPHEPIWRDAIDEIEALRAEVERLRTDLMESDEIREKLGHLLTRTAAALKGEPPAGVWHSWHDLPEKATQLVDALRKLEERVQRDESLASVHSDMSSHVDMDEYRAMVAAMERIDPATLPGLTAEQRCVLSRFAKPAGGLAGNAQPERRPYNASGSLSEYGIFPECDAAPAAPAAPAAQAAQAAQDEALLREALYALEYASDMTKPEDLQGCGCPICTNITALRERLAETTNDLNRCPNCGGPADNGHDRGVPPNPYWCSKCMEPDARVD